MEDTAATTSGQAERVHKVLLAVLGGSVDVSSLGPGADLWEAGMDSLLSVSLLVALEDEFDVEFPDELLTRETFASEAGITAAVTTLAAAA
ncbi:phosphopantetheine-binding protein [Streptomyces bikiniensis]|uniref:phosphopantetheine-binding protein n=1 Tax=Streptomyces bikiniensis TaxID=1896 RepID=UPI0007C84733|nr:phosphopantetheine-binding protein [Streptomyces bikiniensis]